MTNIIIINIYNIKPRIHMIEHDNGKLIFGIVRFNLKKYLGEFKTVHNDIRHYFLTNDDKILYCDNDMLPRIKTRYEKNKYNMRVFEK